MKSNLPPWLAPFVAPVLIFLAVITPVLRVLDYADTKYALGAAITATLISAAWARNVWSTRVESSIYGSTAKHFRFSKLVRYGAIYGLAVCLAATVALSIIQLKTRAAESARPAAAQLPFRIFNGAATPIWLPEAGEIQVLAPSSPALESVVATTRVRIEMPGVFRFGGQPQVDAHSEAGGVVKLPAKFDLDQYVDRGMTVRFFVVVEPLGRLVHSDRLLDSEGVQAGFRLTFDL